MKVKCACGNDITSMKGCRKEGFEYFCKQCGLNITKQKLGKLINHIKENS